MRTLCMDMIATPVQECTPLCQEAAPPPAEFDPEKCTFPGCDGKGRAIGGLGAMKYFEWWPIKVRIKRSLGCAVLICVCVFCLLFHRPIGRARSAQRRASATRDRARASMKSSSKRIRRAATTAMTEAIGHSMRCRSRAAAPESFFIAERPRRAACRSFYCDQTKFYFYTHAIASAASRATPPAGSQSLPSSSRAPSAGPRHSFAADRHTRGAGASLVRGPP